MAKVELRGRVGEPATKVKTRVAMMVMMVWPRQAYKPRVSAHCDLYDERTDVPMPNFFVDTNFFLQCRDPSELP
jgi:hypothetical protein